MSHIQNNRMIFNSHLLEVINDKENHEARLLLTAMHPVKTLVDFTENTLLHYAASYGNEVITKYLIDVDCNIDAQNQNLKTPLMLAVEGFHEWTVEILLRANANIKILDSRGKNVLHIISDLMETIPLSIVMMFLEKVKLEACCNKDIARTLFNANWPLCFAVTLRLPEVTRIMLELGSPIDEVATGFKLTGLHNAVLFSDLANVKVLVDYGADVNVKCVDGSSPLGVLHRLDDTENTKEIIKILLDKSRWTDCDLHVPMQIYDICVSGQRELIRTLMECNVDLCVKDRNGETLLHYLTENKNPGVFEELRGRKFDVNVMNNFGLTPLHKAVWCDNVEAIQFMIEFGANIEATTNNRFTPIFYAFLEAHRSLYEPEDEEEEEDEEDVIPKRDTRIIEILLEHGAKIVVSDHYGTKSIFEVTNFKKSPLSKPIIAHVAMLDILERPINEIIRCSIEADRSIKRRFNVYKRRYERMKITRIYESVTLLDLLTASDQQIMYYARNRELVLNLAHMVNEGWPDSYHYKIIQKRLSDAVVKVDHKNKAAVALNQILRYNCSHSRLAADLIVNYLDESDWCSLRTLLYERK